MKCKYCNSEMRLDDVDYNFKGNKDNYWICEKCNSLHLKKSDMEKVYIKNFINQRKENNNGRIRRIAKTKRCNMVFVL